MNLEKTLRNFGKPFYNGPDIIVPLNDNTGKLVYSSMRSRWEYEERITSADTFANLVENRENPVDISELAKLSADNSLTISHAGFGKNIVQSIKFGDGSTWSAPSKKCAANCSDGKTNHWNNRCLNCGAAQNV